MKKFILIFLILLALGLVFVFLGYLFRKNIENEMKTHTAYWLDYFEKALNERKKPDDKIVFMAVGDIMLDRGVEYMIDKHGKGDYKFPFNLSAEELSKSDILLGNLESLISTKGKKVGSACCSFEANPKATDGLAFAGFNILTVANNHSYDYTTVAFADSLNYLKQAGISYVGGGFTKEEAFSLVVKEIKGTKIGFLGYDNYPTAGWRAKDDKITMAYITENEFPKVIEDVKSAKSQVDILIVTIHAGTEYEKEPNTFQKSFYKELVDAGADMVVGHHPHVIQPVEKYKDSWIAYSLGNFIFDMGFSKDTMEGLVLKANIEGKKILNVEEKKVKMNVYFQPVFVDF